MKIDVVKKTDLFRNYRLDAPYYLSEGAKANRIIDHIVRERGYFSLSDKSIANVWQPNRNTLVYAGEGEEFVPYIQPYDILEFLPSERARLSVHQNDLSRLHVSEGTILQTCSGRNLGPLVIADAYLKQFVLGSDLIRIDVFDDITRYYVYAFFSTWIGQALLHASKTGSVIDHLSIKDVERIRIPLIEKCVMDEVITHIKTSVSAFSEARQELLDLINSFNRIIDVSREATKLSKGWTCTFKDFFSKGRIDAAFYDPATIHAAEQLRNKGGVLLSEMAEVLKPKGRYKTNYVESDYGTPLISGRQLLQNQVVGMKHLPFSSSEKYDDFMLHNGYVAYPADGRVEGRLGTPVCITGNRDGWFASGHIGRVVAKEGVSPGYIYLALSHPVIKAQIHALACGSVVDAVYPDDVAKIIIPPYIDFPYNKVIAAWEKFDTAENEKDFACKILTKYLLRER